MYKKQPLRYVDGIPIFARRDAYVGNYEKIAQDHLDSWGHGGGNPNIEEELWLQLEESTRKLVRQYTDSGNHVLDIGVGLGRVLGPLSNLNRYGIDVSLEYLQKARENGIEVAFAKAEELPYQDDSFDCVIACDVLEHVIDLYSTGKEIQRVLKPGGIFILRVPNKDDLEVYLSEDIPYEYVHLRSFDVPSIRLTFEKIHKLEFVDSVGVSPYLKGIPRFKLKLARFNDPIRERFLRADEDDPLFFMKPAFERSADDFNNWILQLHQENLEAFAEVVEQLVEPLELNAVFRKPRRT